MEQIIIPYEVEELTFEQLGEIMGIQGDSTTDGLLEDIVITLGVEGGELFSDSIDGEIAGFISYRENIYKFKSFDDWEKLNCMLEAGKREAAQAE